MKFVFRLETVMRQRKVEQDLAQKAYADAQDAVRRQMTYIKSLYAESDDARTQSAQLQAKGGSPMAELLQIEEFINLQKIKIQKAREQARELMRVSEEKQEVLIEKSQGFKVLEKLKEKQFENFRKEKNIKLQKEYDDMSTMRQHLKR